MIAKVESSVSHVSFKCLVPGGFNMGFIGSACTASPGDRRRRSASAPAAAAGSRWQGLTLVHFSAQLKRILSDRGAFRDCLGGASEVSGGVKECQGVFRVYFVSETAPVKLRSGRVYAPARWVWQCPASTAARPPPTRGLHSSTFELNLSRFSHTCPCPSVY